jgi:hypothetical protein
VLENREPVDGVHIEIAEDAGGQRFVGFPTSGRAPLLDCAQTELRATPQGVVFVELS